MAQQEGISGYRLSFFTGVFLFVIALTALSGPSQATHFEYKDPSSGKVCILLDIDFTVTIKAYKGTEEIGVVELDSSDENIKVEGDCSEDVNELDLYFPNDTYWAIAFQPKPPHPVGIYRAVQLVPKTAFGEVFPDDKWEGFQDDRAVYLDDNNSSYYCPVLDSYEYILFTKLPTGYNMTIHVDVTYIQAQGFNIIDGSFGPEEICPEYTTTTQDVTEAMSTIPYSQEDDTSEDPYIVTNSTDPTSMTSMDTTESPSVNTTITEPPTSNTTETQPPTTNTTATEPSTSNTTVTEPSTSNYTTAEPSTSSSTTNLTTPYTPVTIAPGTTTGGTGPINTYIVQDGTTACIVMKSAIDLLITYSVNNDTGSETACITIPQDAISSGNCKTTFNTQTLIIDFFETWSVTINFTQLSTLDSSYGISNITISYTIDDDYFPDASVPVGTNYTITTTSDEPNFPATWDGLDYYQCESLTVMNLQENVWINTENLQFKAFNQDSSTTFDGQAAICSADTTSPPKGGLTGGEIAAIVFAVLFVGIVSFFLVLILSRRSGNYEHIN